MAYTGFHPDGDLSGSLLKDRDSSTSISRSQPIMGYTLMSARADPRPIRVIHPDDESSGSLLKDGDSPTSIPQSHPIMGYTLMADCLSRFTAYTSFHPDGDSSESLLKDGDLPTSISWSQPIMRYTLMSVRADPRLYESSP